MRTHAPHTAVRARAGADSAWAAYLAALPERVLTPVCLDDAQLAADVQYAPMVDKIRDMQGRLQHDFDNCSPLDLVPTGSPIRRPCTLRLCWCQCLEDGL